MKKLFFTLCFALSAGIYLNAQTVLFSDDFSNQSTPNWTIVNHYSGASSNVVWKWSNTGESQGDVTGTFDHAGATNGHMIVDSDNDGDTGGAIKEYTTLTSRAIDCSAASTVVLSFTQLYRRFTPDTLQVLLSTDSANWTVVYSPTATVNVNATTANPQVVEANVTALAAGQTKVFIRFSWKSTWGYWWFLDDVKLLVPPALDARVLAAQTTFTNGCNLTNAEPVSMLIANKGTSAISSFTASFSVNGGTPVSETVNLSTPLAFDSSVVYTFTAAANLTAENLYEVAAWVTLASDAIVANDTAFAVALSINPAAPATTAYSMGFEVPPVGSEVGGLAWETVDANNDGYTWFLSAASANTGQVHYRYSWNTNGTTGANDWLISTCMDLDATKAYKLSFFSEVGEDNNGLYEEKVRVRYGNARTAAAMTQNIFDFGTQSNSSYEERKAAFKPSSTGTYYIGFQCYSDADKWFLDIDDVNISLLSPPVAQFTPSSSGLTLNVVDASTELITNWEWNWGDGQTSTGQNPGPHTYTTGAGSYDVCLKVTNLAGTDSICKTLLISGLDKADVSDFVAVFPNPTNHIITVALNHDLKYDAQIELVNILGEVVESRAATGNEQEQFNLSRYATGVYTVRISNATVKAVKKFVYAK